MSAFLLFALFCLNLVVCEESDAVAIVNGLPDCSTLNGLTYDCREYCIECKGATNISSAGSQVASAVSTAVASANAFRDYVKVLQSDTGICKSNTKCANMVGCISSVISTIDRLIAEWETGQLQNLPLLIQAFCTVVSCAKTVGLPTDKVPFFNYFGYACTVGQIGAKQIKCRDYSNNFLGVMGLPTACRQSMINAQPIVLEPCASGNRLTVAACRRDSNGNLVNRPYSDIQRDCVSAVVNPRRVPRVPQLQYGTCARWCFEQTSKVACFQPPPPGPGPVPNPSNTPFTGTPGDFTRHPSIPGNTGTPGVFTRHPSIPGNTGTPGVSTHHPSIPGNPGVSTRHPSIPGNPGNPGPTDLRISQNTATNVRVEKRDQSE